MKEGKAVMDFDVGYNLGEVDRAVSFRERDGHSAGAVTLSRSFDAAIEDVWDGVTNVERISRWFTPVSGELELGGHFQLEGNASGTITACERLSHFAVTWEFGGDMSWVDVSLEATEEGQSCLTLTHTAILSAHWDEYGPGAAGVGWEWGLLGLAIHLEQPTEPMPGAAEFVASDSGRAFFAGSSEGWAEAAVSARAEPDAARAAAERTTAFYTGESGEPA